MIIIKRVPIRIKRILSDLKYLADKRLKPHRPTHTNRIVKTMYLKWESFGNEKRNGSHVQFKCNPLNGSI